MAKLGTSENPYQFGVMGNPIKFSKSPWIHGEFAKQFNLAINYYKIQPEINNFTNAVANFRSQGGYGFNITLPFKEEAFCLATEHSARATLAKAVNTIVFKQNAEIYGDNTDGVGLVRDIVNNCNFSLQNKTILVLGAGGAVRGILHPLLCENPARLIIANRTINKALQLAMEFQTYGEVHGCGFDKLANQGFDLVIDGTAFNPLRLPLPENLKLNPQSLCYDLKYSNTATPFLQWAFEKKAGKVTDGLGMLIEQAAEAFFLWTGKMPITAPVFNKARKTFYETG